MNLILCLSVFLQLSYGVQKPKIQTQLYKIFETGQSTTNVLISFKGGIAATLLKASNLRKTYTSRGQRNTALLKMLDKNADTSQFGVITILSSLRSNDGQGKGYKYFKQYKSSNLLFIKDANFELVKILANDAQVNKIETEPAAGSVEPLIQTDNTPTTKQGNECGWNIKTIQVAEAWQEVGSKGDGVLVGHIDSGVMATHESLRDSFLGTNYGWFDAVDKTTEPYETSGVSHGTATLGILAGSNGIGVAPGAKWISCLACKDVSCEAEHLLDCIQWIECPTLPNGSNPDCSKAPHVVNNSWASDRGETGYNEFIMRWREMGIIPVFAIGNKGTKCGTTQAPGEMPFVIGVGGSKENDYFYHFTGVGPASDGRVKPDILAPGYGVLSASKLGGVVEYGGTSIASPHVAGAIALLKARQLDLTYEEAYLLLIQNTDRNITVERDEFTCEMTENEHPSIFFGYGRLNILKAVQAQTIVLAKNGKRL